MPVLDTEVLFALNPKDSHHRGVARLLASREDFVVPDTSLLEYLTVLRAMNLKAPETKRLLLALDQDLGDRGISQAKTLDALLLAKQSELETSSDLTFFDSLVAASALSLDQAIVSDDRAFDSVPGLKRIPLG